MVNVPFVLVIGMVVATSLDLFIAPLPNPVNKKDEAKKMDAAPRLATPVANTAPSPPEPIRTLQVTY